DARSFGRGNRSLVANGDHACGRPGEAEPYLDGRGAETGNGIGHGAAVSDEAGGGVVGNADWRLEVVESRGAINRNRPKSGAPGNGNFDLAISGAANQR